MKVYVLIGRLEVLVHRTDVCTYGKMKLSSILKPEALMWHLAHGTRNRYFVP